MHWEGHNITYIIFLWKASSMDLLIRKEADPTERDSGKLLADIFQKHLWHERKRKIKELLQVKGDYRSITTKGQCIIINWIWVRKEKYYITDVNKPFSLHPFVTELVMPYMM